MPGQPHGPAASPQRCRLAYQHLPLDALDLAQQRPTYSGKVQHVLVHHAYAGFADRCDRQIFVPGSPQLADDEHIQRRAECGGHQTIVAPMQISPVASFAMFADPTGNIVGLLRQTGPVAG